MIRAAIAGLGRWGRRLVESAPAELRFVRAVDPDPKGADYARAVGLPCSGSLDEALADASVEAVVLATPHSLHREQVIATAEAGKHVFCEKPLALSVADVEAMIAAARAKGVRLAVGHNRRFWPAMRALKACVADGRLGRLLHVEGHNSNENSNAVTAGWRTDPAESPGGGFTGAGLHVLDSFIYLLGRVSSVRAAQLVTYRSEPPPLDAMSALYEFENGCSGYLATVRATPFFWRVHVFGSLGSAEVLGETRMVLRLPGKEPETLDLPPADSVRAELEAFARSVSRRDAYPIDEGDMRATVEAFEATLRALAR